MAGCAPIRPWPSPPVRPSMRPIRVLVNGHPPQSAPMRPSSGNPYSPMRPLAIESEGAGRVQLEAKNGDRHE